MSKKMINRQRLLRRFLRLVKIDSLSLKEGKLVKLLKRELTSLGVKCYEDPVGKDIGGEAGNLIGTLAGKVKDVPTLMFNAHLDTVGPGKGISPRVKRGIVKSRGKTILGADDKAGVAVILEAISVLREGNLPHGPIQLVFTVAEEIGLLGSKSFRKSKLKADLGYTLDGGQVENIITKAPSQDSMEAVIIGRAAHAGVHPEEGINAIKVASEAIAKMKLGRIDKETTANIGIIKGGTATNIIPERVEIKGEARSHDFKKLKRQIKHMEKTLKKACKKYKARLKVKVGAAYRTFDINPREKVVEVARQAAKKIGLRAKIKATGGGSDANIFNSYGLPTIILGAGARRVHTTQEFLSIKDMVKATELVLAITRESLNYE